MKNLTLAEVAQRYNCHTRTIKRWYLLGIFPPPIQPRPRCRLNWREADLEAFDRGEFTPSFQPAGSVPADSITE